MGPKKKRADDSGVSDDLPPLWRRWGQKLRKLLLSDGWACSVGTGEEDRREVAHYVPVKHSPPKKIAARILFRKHFRLSRPRPQRG